MTNPFRLGSAALYARDAKKLASFYRSVFDMQLAAFCRKHEDQTFLAFRPETDYYEISFVGDPRQVQMTFYAESLGALQGLWRNVRSRGIRVHGPYTEGWGVSFQFGDPEGNRIEVLWPQRLKISRSAIRAIQLESWTDADIGRWQSENREDRPQQSDEAGE